MSDSPPYIPGIVQICAAIGFVCLQWSRLEMALLGIINALEDISPEKGDIMFGSLSWEARIKLARNLSEAGSAPPEIRDRLDRLWKQLSGPGSYNGLAQRRNQVVHGAHKEFDDVKTTLTMVRWKGEHRDKELTAAEIGCLAEEICAAGSEAWSIFQALGEWKFPGEQRADEDT